uniref:Uncharacterized protein n=1 Tax=viral metagenome TaxID=1070528 RepID=A0A6C0BCY0_9ZZZZ
MENFEVLFSFDSFLQEMNLFIPSDEFYDDSNNLVIKLTPSLLPYNEVVNLLKNHSNRIVENKIKELIDFIKIYGTVDFFVVDILEFILREYRFISRIKIEKIMNLLKTGINSKCNKILFEKFIELEYYIYIYYPQDNSKLGYSSRDYFYKKLIEYSRLAHSDNNIIKGIFKTKLCRILTFNNGDITLRKHIENIQTINQSSVDSQLRKRFMFYFYKVHKTLDLSENSVYCIEIVRTILNCINYRLLMKNIKTIEFSKICIDLKYEGKYIIVNFCGFFNNGEVIISDEYNSKNNEELFAGIFSIDIRNLYKKISHKNQIIRRKKLAYILTFMSLIVYILNNRKNVLNINIENFRSIIENDILLILEDDTHKILKNMITNAINKNLSQIDDQLDRINNFGYLNIFNCCDISRFDDIENN